ATVVTPNLVEAAHAANHPVDPDGDLETVVDRLRACLGDSALLVTRGANGMSLAGHDGAADVLDIPAVVRSIFEVTGAGDAVVSTLAMVLARGGTLEEGARLANVAAGVVVGKVGTATATLDEL